MNDGWLSEEACLEGASIGGPFTLARLSGLEKLNAGLGKRVPPTDISELIEGDRGMKFVVGEMGELENPLPEECCLCSAG